MRNHDSHYWYIDNWYIDNENKNEYNEHANALSGKDDYNDSNRVKENSLDDNKKVSQSSSIFGGVYVVEGL